jgi:hypothetical protein
MKILDRDPVPDRPQLLTVQSDVVQVHRNQIIVWVGIANPSRRFPAILDTGHSHNFSIAERHLDRWAGITTNAIQKIGELEINHERVAQYAAIVHIHQTLRGKISGMTYPLEMPQGISVFPDSSTESPRLPLLGLRAILSNRLRLVIDGKRRETSLKTSGWF